MANDVTAMSMFTVSLTPVGSPAWPASPEVDSKVAEPCPGVEVTDAQVTSEGRVERFKALTRRATAHILARPAPRCTRKKSVAASSPRRSRWLVGRMASPAGVSRQQRVRMHRLGIAREGERIGEEALQAYTQLFAKPLNHSQISAIVALFGWEHESLPLEEAGDGVIVG